MKQAIAVASIAILFGATNANANSAPADPNILQVAQKTTKESKRTGKRWHPALYKKGTYRSGERASRRGSYGKGMQEPR
jgi:hypothetical protein